MFNLLSPILRPLVPAFLHPWILPTELNQHTEPNIGKSEVDNGPLANRTSVYLHLEQGLARSPNEPAIISTQQSAGLLATLGLQPRQKEQAGELQSKNDRLRGLTETPRGADAARGRERCLTLSFAQVHHIAQDLAAGMMIAGAQPNSKILMLIPNGAEYGLLLWMSVILRLTFICADPAALGASDLLELLSSLKPSIIVVSTRRDAVQVDACLTRLRLPQPVRVSTEEAEVSVGWTSLADLADAGLNSGIDREELLEQARNDDPQRLHSILFTSGTSGQSKGCPQRVGNMTHVLHAQAWLLAGGAGNAALQQAHPSRGIAPAQTLQTWRAGGAVIMTGRGFSVEDMVQALQSQQVTFLVLTPPMVYALEKEIKERSLDVSSVRSIQVGGDAVTRTVLTRCAATFPNASVFVNHGMTEGGGAFTWPFFDTCASEIRYLGEICPVGVVSPGSRVRIWDVDQRNIAKRGDPGELHVSSGSIIGNYLFGRDSTSFYEEDGRHWFNTGDVAVMTDEGLVYILGRIKDRIRRAGTTVMPAPIESCLDAYTGATTAVVAIRTSSQSAEPWAVLNDFHGKGAGDIGSHVKRVLGREYQLDGVVSLKQLGLAKFPVNATHKIARVELQQAVLKYLDQRT